MKFWSRVGYFAYYIKFMFNYIFNIWLGVDAEICIKKILYWFSGGQTHFSTLRGARMSVDDPNEPM